MGTHDSWELLVRRHDPSRTRVLRGGTVPLARGQVRLRVERFGLTANNVTYARLGDSELPFWDAFPAPDGWGRVPVWGFSRVVESRHPKVPPGGRYFGYLPMGTHSVLTVRPEAEGLLDTSPERAFLHRWYRTHRRCGGPDDGDDLRTLLRPLYPASYNVARFVDEHAERGARSLVVTSASSRTAVGAASLLAGRTDLVTVGLTSPGNRAPLLGLGVYDHVLPYSELDRASVPAPTVFADFSGDEDRISDVYRRLGEGIVHTALVGYTHPRARIEPPDLDSPRPEIFFTPDREEERAREEGPENYRRAYAAAEERFVSEAGSWLAVRRLGGPEEVANAWRDLMDGRGSPLTGDVCLP
ncbi:DUF2855 family protein [Nocardiopsis quinghaiensis]|uniref:DUF2855 family protein n=1 Tax=Nocardiopsis quinghaiensis TaxID=464995 RepID=UPI0016804BDB|nr:DUF2855 family protein [Nocardiopsis quinghaiensis]